MATVGLFIPCYIDQLYPRVGLATVELLERYGFQVVFPEAQTCCGQPMANTGCLAEARPLAERFLEIFSPYDYVVAPSGSCVAMVRCHYDELLAGRPGFAELKAKTFELCEFLCDVVGDKEMPGRFPYRVGLHQSCHGLRELRLGSSSERVEAAFGKVRQLLAAVEGVELVTLAAARRMLRFRRHVRRGRGSGFVPDGPGSHGRPCASRGPGADGQRHVVPDAHGRFDPPAAAAATGDARGRDSGGISRMNQPAA